MRAEVREDIAGQKNVSLMIKSLINMSALRDEMVCFASSSKGSDCRTKECIFMIKSLREECNALTVACAQKDEKIKNPEDGVEDLEQHSRQDDVIITGLKTKHQTRARKVNNASVDNHADAPVSEIDTLESQVIQFLEQKDIDIDKRDISIVHTLKSTQMNKPVIIMRMTNQKAFL